MNIDAIKTFLAVSEHASFSAAASALDLTQPAISKRISVLEADLGVKLLDRADKTVALTPAGKKLVPRARLILAEIDKTRISLTTGEDSLAGNLQLATNHHMGIWRLPHLLESFRQEHPKVAMDLQFMDSEAAYRSIQSRDIELALITLPSSSRTSRFEHIPIWTENLCFVTASTDPLLDEPDISLDTLARYPAVLPDDTTYTGRIIRRLFSQAGLSLQVSTSTNYLETLKMLSSIGFGWTMVPTSMVDESLTPLAFQHHSARRDLGFVYLRHRTLSDVSKAFIRMAESLSTPSA